MKLYFTKGACSLAVRIIINEIGLKCDYESVNLKEKQTESGINFLTINPKGSVPTLLTDDGHVLTENAVIQIYLAEKHQATTLLPPINHFERYEVLEWLNFVATELHKSFSPLFNPQFPKDVINEVIIPLIKRKFLIPEKQLQTNKYLLGESFTLPDGYLFVMILWAQAMKIDLSDYPNLLKYFKTVKHRQSIIESLQQEGLMQEKESSKN